MNRYGRLRKSIVFLIAERSYRDAKCKKFIESASGISILYWTCIANEETLHSTLLSCPHTSEKIIVVLIDEPSLQSRQFRQCLQTIATTSLKTIVFVDKKLTKERILNYFEFLSNKRYSKIEHLIEDSIILENEEQILSRTISKIRQLSSPKPEPIFMKKDFTLPSANRRSSIEVKLSQCIVQQKAVLSEPIQKYKCYSYHLAGSVRERRRGGSGRILNTSTFTRRDLMSAPVNLLAQGTKPRPKTRKTESTTPSKIIGSRLSSREKIRNNISKEKTEKPTLKIEHKKSFETEKTIVFPTIEISSEDSDDIYPDKITNKNKNMPWLERAAVMNTEKREKQTLSSPLTHKRFSFDYISKTYMVCDPSKAKAGNELLYVSFPQGLNVLRRDSEIFNSDSRRSSILFSIGSSIDDLNLETIYDSMNFAESSPIPSPNLLTHSMYQEPLPAFSEDTCFPPLDVFPCEILQRRRPSVFDVLKTCV